MPLDIPGTICSEIDDLTADKNSDTNARHMRCFHLLDDSCVNLPRRNLAAVQTCDCALLREKEERISCDRRENSETQ